MRAPNTYWITHLIDMAKACQREHPTLKWTPARPYGLSGLALMTRFRAAWLVFTGKADVVKWFDVEPK